MDNLLHSYLRATNESEAQLRLDELLLVGDPKSFPHNGISVEFSRLKRNRGIVNLSLARTVRSIYARL